MKETEEPVVKGIPLESRAKEQGFHARFALMVKEPKRDGRCRVTLQLIHNRKVKRYSTGLSAKPEHWDEDASRVKVRAPGRAATNPVLEEIQTRVRNIVTRLVVNGCLSLETFEARYRKPKANEDVLAFMRELELGFIAEDRLSYGRTFRTAAAALSRYNDGKPVPFADLTAKKLEGLEKFLRADCTNGGIASYMRCIRVAVNTAIKEGLMSAEQYPFETNRNKGYSMARLKSRFNPRSLTEQHMDMVKAFPHGDHPHLSDTVRIFLFSYYARGMNFRDVAYLKKADVYDGRIHYRRRKTNDAFSIPVSDTLAEIIEAFAATDTPYLFPILDIKHRSERQQYDRIQKCMKRVNKELKEVAAVLGLDVPLTTYVARHTFATTLKRKGVGIDVISESMGHENVSTTRAYLKRFGSEVLDEADKLL